MKIAVAGGQGHMGRAVASIISADPDLTYLGSFGRFDVKGEGLIDRVAALETADVILDFSTASAAAALAALCAKMGGPALVIAATGFEPEQIAEIGEAAHQIPIVRSGNFSVGLNMLVGLVAQVARALPADTWDIEILEAHHRRKIDAPSGTALMLGEASARGRGVSLASVERRGRDGITGERPDGEIGFSVMRGGGIVGEHSVIFAAGDEVVKLSHSAIDRGMFARGAIVAAHWVRDRAPGEYDMHDVLGLSRKS
jgi:4-hydroxy-tetrahydrodipicolinate reductase